MANVREPFDVPGFAPNPYGLLSVATELPGPGDGKWERDGTTWTEICPDGGTTFDDCAPGDSQPTEGRPKTVVDQVQIRAANPFTVYTQFDCPAQGLQTSDGENAVGDLAERALARVSNRRVESAFLTGQADGEEVVFPHLAADTTVTEDVNPGDGAVLLQMPADEVIGSLVNPVQAIVALDGALGECYGGVGVIHVPSGHGAALTDSGAIRLVSGRWKTPNDNLVVLGNGYSPSVAPNGGVAPTGTAWYYATGQVWYHRGPVRSFTLEETLDRRNNSVDAIAERPYLVGFECCLIAQNVEVIDITP